MQSTTAPAASEVAAATTGPTTTVATETTATTAAPETTGTTAAPAPETTTTTAFPDRFVVLQVMARYDGVTGAGTLEATVCNGGDDDLGSTEVVISVAGNDRVVMGGPLGAGECDPFYDPLATLEDYGVTGLGTYDVSVTVRGSDAAPPVTAVETLDVRILDASAPADQLQRYRDCLASGQNHRNCVGNVPHRPIGDAREVMKANGRYLAIGPATHDEIISFFLADDALCAPRVEQWMGISGPQWIAHRLVVTDDYSGGYATPYVAMYSLGSDARWTAADVDTWWHGLLQGWCENPHEMTHLVLGDTPMPSWLNEGLATYMEADARSGSGRPPAVECREHTWYGSLFEGGVGEMAYQDLTTWNPDVPGIYYYYTAMCFWDYLDRSFGTPAIREVLDVTAAHRDPAWNGCGAIVGSVLFLPDIVTPVIGEDISAVTESRWGFGPTWTSCEGT